MCTKSAQISFRVHITTPTASNFTPSVCISAHSEPLYERNRTNLLTIPPHCTSQTHSRTTSLSLRPATALSPRPHSPPSSRPSLPGLCLVSPTGHSSQPPATNTTPPPSSRPSLPHLCLVSLTGHSSQPPATHTTTPPDDQQASRTSALALLPCTAVRARPLTTPPPPP